MPKEGEFHALEIQHNLLTPSERDMLMTTLMNASVVGHKGFTKVILTIMGFTVGGRLTHEQADVVTRQAELLFTNLCAQHIQEAGVKAKTDVDPLVASIKAAQAEAHKIRPQLTMDSEGNHQYEILDAQGKAVPLLRSDK